MSVTILHVDDDPLLPQGLASHLTVAGYQLVQTEDPDEARRRVASGEPDVVLLDPLLATCDGMAYLEELASAPGIRVVVYTRGERSDELWGRALELGVTHFVTKPATVGQLMESLESALRGDAESEADPEEVGREEADAAAPQPGSLARSGTLAERGLAGLLHDIRVRAWSGVAIVNRGAERLGIQLRNGNPVAVSASGEREPLEAYLLRTGRLTEEQHDKLFEQLSAGMGSVREILVGMDVLSEEAIEDAVRTQADEPLLRAFAYSDADYHLLPGKRLKAKAAHEVTTSGALLLFHGALRQSPIEEVRRELERSGALYVSEGDEAEELGAEIGVTRAQADAIEALQGDRSLAEVAASGTPDERLLYAFLRVGLVTLHEEPMLMLLEAVEEPPAEAVPDAASAPAGRGASKPAPPRSARTPSAADFAAAAPAAALGAEDFDRIQKELASLDAYGVLRVGEESDEAIRAAYEARLAELGLDGPAPSDPKLARRATQLRTRLEKAWEQIADAPARQRYGAVRQKEKEEQAANEAAHRALEAESWFRKGGGFLKAKQYSEAVEAFGMAAHLDPEEGEYLSHLGWALYLTNPKVDMVKREANEHLAKGIKLSPERPLPYVFLGRMFKANGAEERARKMFQKATRLDPECHPALQELRLMNMRQEKGKGLLGRLRRK